MHRDEIAVLFSGGTDSTLTAALMQEQFRRVHLVTYDRFGFHSTGNTSVNAKMLQEKYGDERFVHRLMNFDPLFRHLSYERYIKNWFKYGFFMLSTCGLCKLAMHTKTAHYCVTNKVGNVCDGANMGMSIFPDQMKEVLDELRGLYGHFGLSYSNPVYEMTPPEEKQFVTEANLQLVPALAPTQGKGEGPTPGQRLHQLGLAPEANVKGSEYDRQRQPRCHQLVLFNVFAHQYFNAAENYESYCEKTLVFYRSKIETARQLLEEHLESGKHAELFA